MVIRCWLWLCAWGFKGAARELGVAVVGVGVVIIAGVFADDFDVMIFGVEAPAADADAEVDAPGERIMYTGHVGKDAIGRAAGDETGLVVEVVEEGVGFVTGICGGFLFLRVEGHAVPGVASEDRELIPVHVCEGTGAVVNLTIRDGDAVVLKYGRACGEIRMARVFCLLP